MRFLWYDYETSGQDPAADRVVQVGWLKTDAGMEPLSEAKSQLVKVPDDVIPSPHALLIHQIPPDIHQAQGITEAELASHLEILIEPKTIVAGYNSRQFDDRFTQHICFRCLRDPYAWQWADGRGRFDLYPVVLTYFIMAPDAILWPEDIDGQPRFKLERLGPLNQLDTGLSRAHDASADVIVTARLARQLAHHDPDLFADCLKRIEKNFVINLIRSNGRSEGLIEFSSMFGWQSGFARDLWIPFRLANKTNDYVGFDLSKAPEEVLARLNEIILRPVEERRSLLNDCGVQIVRANAQPMLFRRDELVGDILKRLSHYGRDIERQNRNRDVWHDIQESADFKKLYELVLLAFEETERHIDSDVDFDLYSGKFLSPGDRARLKNLSLMDPNHLALFDESFDDPRYDELLFRYRARNFMSSLNQSEWQRWQLIRKAKLSRENSRALTVIKVRNSLLEVSARTDLDSHQLELITKYMTWLDGVPPV